VIAGGGTGGHVIPAIAIGQALVDRGQDRAGVRFVGSQRGMEARLVPAAGFDVTLLPGRGIARRLTVDNLGAIVGLVAAAVRGAALIRRWKPAVVISVGGYASVAGALAAVVWRRPLVVAEQNAVPGVANRLAGRFAAACAVSFVGTPLPRAVVTGNPIRAEMLAVDRSDAGRATARAQLGLPLSGLVVAVAGGSLGARRINEAVLALARLWAGRDGGSPRPGVAIRHVVGERDFDAMAAGWAAGSGSGGAGSGSGGAAGGTAGFVYQQVRFEDRMDRLYAAADVAVQRSGAGTVFELAVAALPSVLVPLPGAPGDHQMFNARHLADAGAAVVVPDADLTADRLAAELEALLGDPARRDGMAGAARSLARPHAAADVAALAETHARA
jgi:undecaprenyldiphospho-muramoylpentapeptide beta-N-acetylglucosaminyltransferase